ncbi:hypothetical protein PFISCL1PPCAC_6010 [Pristionchus fissidentatus]|uniref:CTCHY-type domain-containing protein n=1 Tax=Pristionchus fissidentatus TaxID=1538716 RepID=A0AAV5V933_9BILA|nr:hypothetical protein PFISCL1PPCAC_6010 [Pristionchus fissidentatus]
MSKGKTRQQKKKFFKRKENRGKVFVKKEAAPKPTAPPLRERGRYDLVHDYEGEVQSCSHGPCLLFKDKKENKRYFSCAIFRDTEKCSFKAYLKDDGSVERTNTDEVAEVEKKYPYGVIPKQLKKIPKGSKIVFCPKCMEVFADKHKHPGSFVTRPQLRNPSRLLEAMDDQHGMAQFWFSDESLSVVSSAISNGKYDGVLCMGSPRLFESLKEEKKEGRQLFMLDWDQRYLSFFLSKFCARYSLLTDFFPDPKAEQRLNAFLAGVSRLIVISDPPFGVFVEPLMKSIQAMRKRHVTARGSSPAVSHSIVFLPFFVGKHALRNYEGELCMSDYRVLYANHKEFSRPHKTTVRMLTDMKKECIDLSDVNGYKFCDMCEKHVVETNKHCGMCGDCTSRDGQPTRHCDLCMRCYKDSYKHCKQCTRCHLAGRCPIESEKARAKDAELMAEWEEKQRLEKIRRKEERMEQRARERKEKEEERERIRKEMEEERAKEVSSGQH